MATKKAAAKKATAKKAPPARRPPRRLPPRRRQRRRLPRKAAVKRNSAKKSGGQESTGPQSRRQESTGQEEVGPIEPKRTGARRPLLIGVGDLFVSTDGDVRALNAHTPRQADSGSGLRGRAHGLRRASVGAESAQEPGTAFDRMMTLHPSLGP